jgi:cell division protein FtsL
MLPRGARVPRPCTHRRRKVMFMCRRLLAVSLAILMIAPVAQAQQHSVDRSALEQAVRQRVAEEQADREAIKSLLRRSEVREIAANAGLSLERAEAAVSTLDGDDLRELASQARQVQNDLAGGASTIVISTTTIIIVLLVVILIVLIAD